MKLLSSVCKRFFSTLTMALDGFIIQEYDGPTFDARIRALDDYWLAYNLYQEWRRARPYLRVGQSPYAQKLVRSMIGAHEQYLLLKGEDTENNEVLEYLHRLLNWDPPDYPPTGLALHGLLFYTKQVRTLTRTAVCSHV